MWDDVRHEARSEVAHATTDAARAEAPPLTTERDGPAPAAVAAPCEDQAMGQNTAAKERFDLGQYERGQCRWIGHGLDLCEKRLPVGLERLPEHRLLWPVALVPAAVMARALDHAAVHAIDEGRDGLRHAPSFSDAVATRSGQANIGF